MTSCDEKKIKHFLQQPTFVVPAEKVGQRWPHAPLRVQLDMRDAQTDEALEHALLQIAKLSESIVFNHGRQLEGGKKKRCSSQCEKPTGAVHDIKKKPRSVVPLHVTQNFALPDGGHQSALRA